MNEQTTPTPGAETLTAQQQNGMQMLVDERDLRTFYGNAYRLHPLPEEVILDLGFNMPNPAPAPGQKGQQLLLKLNDRVIMNYANAKRLMLSLQQVVGKYEQQHGVLPVK